MDEETFNISPEKVEEAITPKTKAILGVHVFGNPCDVKALSQIAKDHNLKLLFDSAGAFASEYRGKKVGNFGDAESFSTGPSKIFCTIEGGFLTSNDKELLEDLITGAVNQALKKARQQVAEETSKMATGLGLPVGMNLPGLS